MSLATVIQNLATRVGTEFKAIRTLIGGAATSGVGALATTATNLVGAINEVRSTANSAASAAATADGKAVAAQNAANAKPSINDTTASASAVYSSNKVKALTDANASAAAAAQTAANGKAVINDAATNATQVWSSTKTNSEITTKVNAAVNAIADGAPGALDTLNELAAAIGDDANFAGTISTALANRVRYDAAQTLTAAQKLTACNNIGVGDPTTDYVAVFETALAAV